MDYLFQKNEEISSYIQNIVKNITFSIMEPENKEISQQNRNVFIVIDNINSISNLNIFQTKRKNYFHDQKIENMFLTKKKIKPDISLLKNSMANKENLYR